VKKLAKERVHLEGKMFRKIQTKGQRRARLKSYSSEHLSFTNKRGRKGTSNLRLMSRKQKKKKRSALRKNRDGSSRCRETILVGPHNTWHGSKLSTTIAFYGIPPECTR